MTPQLRKVTLKRSLKASLLEKIFTYWPNLTDLKIECLQSMEYDLMKHIFEKCPNIRKLKLGLSLFEQRHVELLSTLEHLHSLELFMDCERSVSYRALAHACPRLEEINFQWLGHDVDDVADFLKAKQDSITSATLSWALGCKHTVPGCLTQLRRLRVMDTRELRNETVVAISRGCPNLCELSLHAICHVTDRGLSEIHRLKNLKILELVCCNRLRGSAISYIAQLPALHTLRLKVFDLANLQPGLHNIVDMKELQYLEMVRCRNLRTVPFDEFPGRLVKLRELRVPYDEDDELFCKDVFAGLQRKMPHLQVFNTLWLEDGDNPEEQEETCDSSSDSYVELYDSYSYDELYDADSDGYGIGDPASYVSSDEGW